MEGHICPSIRIPSGQVTEEALLTGVSSSLVTRTTQLESTRTTGSSTQLESTRTTGSSTQLESTHTTGSSTQLESTHTTGSSTQLELTRTTGSSTQLESTRTTGSSTQLESTRTTGSSTTRTPKVESTLLIRKLSAYRTTTIHDSPKLEDDGDDDPYVTSELKGMLAWAIISTIIILLMLIRRWLLSKLKCNCQCPAQQDTPPAPPAPPVPQPNPAFTPQAAGLGANLLHTPPSLAITPSTTASTPSTVRSNIPLVTPEEGAIATRTRSQTAIKKKLNL